jgi:hypothetical protein
MHICINWTEKAQADGAMMVAFLMASTDRLEDVQGKP